MFQLFVFYHLIVCIVLYTSVAALFYNFIFKEHANLYIFLMFKYDILINLKVPTYIILMDFRNKHFLSFN